MKAIWVMLVSLSALALLITPVHADDSSVDLGAVPQQLATALGVNLFVGQLLSSLLFMSFFLFPSMLIAGYFGGAGAVMYDIIIVGLATSSVCLALGWLPFWLYFMLAILIALLLSGTVRGWITGHGEGS